MAGFGCVILPIDACNIFILLSVITILEQKNYQCTSPTNAPRFFLLKKLVHCPMQVIGSFANVGAADKRTFKSFVKLLDVVDTVRPSQLSNQFSHLTLPHISPSCPKLNFSCHEGRRVTCLFAWNFYEKLYK